MINDTEVSTYMHNKIEYKVLMIHDTQFSLFVILPLESMLKENTLGKLWSFASTCNTSVV